MKAKAIIVATLLFCYTGLVQAQSKRSSVEERVANVITKFENTLKLDKATQTTVAEVFTDFYTAQDKIRDKVQGPATTLGQGFAPQDYQSVRKQNEKIRDERDNRLKKILSAEQYKKWTDEIEPSLKSRK